MTINFLKEGAGLANASMYGVAAMVIILLVISSGLITSGKGTVWESDQNLFSSGFIFLAINIGTLGYILRYLQSQVHRFQQKNAQ